MTSVEFVIWMRGFMAGQEGDCVLYAAQAKTLREQLAKVDGVPLPREKRTNLRTPMLLLPAKTEDVT